MNIPPMATSSDTSERCPQSDQKPNHSCPPCDHSEGMDGSSTLQSESTKPLSKKQLKKLRKTQKWEENKMKKRQEERARKKARRKQAREQGLELAPSRKSLKRITMAGSTCPVRVVVDCAFDDLMSDKDIANIVRQINHCYAVNRRTENPVQFSVTSVEKRMKARLEALKEYQFWDVNFSGQSYLDLFTKSEVVYLSSDSDNILESLQDDKVYVIGGLIDHNHHKGLCHKIATGKGLSHARLPITDYVKFNSRKVLTVNQVFEILVGYTEKKDWEYAFLKAIPKRKEATAKRTAAEGDCSNSSEQNEKQINDSYCSEEIENCASIVEDLTHSKKSRSESDEVGACIISQTKNEGPFINSQTENEGACSDTTDTLCFPTDKECDEKMYSEESTTNRTQIDTDVINDSLSNKIDTGKPSHVS